MYGTPLRRARVSQMMINCCFNWRRRDSCARQPQDYVRKALTFLVEQPVLGCLC